MTFKENDAATSPATADTPFVSLCVKAWEAISKFLQVLTELHPSTYDPDEREEMYRILDHKFSRQPDCHGCSLSGYLEFAKTHRKNGMNLLAVNLDYLRHPKIVNTDIRCTEGPDNLAPASTFDLEDASSFGTAPRHRRVIEPYLDLQRDPTREAVTGSTPTFGRIMESIDRGNFRQHKP